MTYPKVILMLSSPQAWFLYHVLRFVPGATARRLRADLGQLLESLRDVK